MKAVAAVAGILLLPPAATAATSTLVQVEPALRGTAVPALALHRAEPVAPSLGVWRVSTAAARQILPGMRAAGLVAAAEPDVVLAPALTPPPTDELFPRQWWLAHVGADRAEPPGPGRPLTVIDTGLDLAHPEFARRPDTAVLNTQTTVPRRRFDDAEHHGTAVASVAAAPANGVGVVGVYPRAVLRSWDAAPQGEITLGEIISGIDAASSAGPGVINLSLGGPFDSDLFEAVVGVAYGRGSLIVAASGNSRQEGSPASFPANFPHVLTVGATNEADVVSDYSTASPLMDLVAPGDNIPVAVPLSVAQSGYATASGTSFAAPIVAGAAAWVWTQRPELDNTQLFEVLRRSARDVGAAGWDPDSGFGILDIPGALTVPPPVRDPLEPNDDLDYVRGGGLLQQPPLTTPTRGSARVLARLDAKEDPDDVYRIYVPAGRSVTVQLRPVEGDADLELWSNAAVTLEERVAGLLANRLARSARAGAVAESVTWANRGRGPVMVYADALPRTGTASATYMLTVSTKVIPKPKRRR